MGAGEDETGARMIKFRAQPGGGAVALCARLRESDLEVIGILGAVIVLEVTADATGRRALELAPDMARIAVQGGMCAGEGKAGESQVIEGRSCPRIHRPVALLAVGREVQGHVTGRFRTGERSHVATDAIGGQPLELSDRGAFMTGLAIRDRVRSDERKAVLVFADGLQRDRPPVHAVTLLALRPHLAAMDIGVAVGALVADVGEHRIDVAFHAGHVLVQSHSDFRSS